MMQEYEDEINLIDYVVVILKRKWLILAVFLLAVLMAGTFSYLSPKIYEINTTFQIGNINKEAIKNPEQVKEKIAGDVYGVQARNNLNITEEEYPKLKTENPKNTSLIRISIESSETQRAKDILEEMNRLILEDHQKIINSKKESIEKKIETIENKIKLVESDITNTRNKINPLEADILRIKNKIKNAEEEKENLEAKVESLEQVLVYEQTPGTQFALFDTKEKLASKKQEIESLYMNINSLERTREDLRITINHLEIEIENFNNEVISLEASLDEIEPTRVVREPNVSAFPVKPNKKLNIAIAGVLGLFIGIFLAFGKEFWEKNKNNLKKTEK